MCATTVSLALTVLTAAYSLGPVSAIIGAGLAGVVYRTLFEGDVEKPPISGRPA